jgi:DNA-directed RNA polymerase subunit RPC12/RpoP
MISFHCPECQASIRSTLAQIGDRLRCRDCRQLVRVPDDAKSDQSKKSLIIGLSVGGGIVLLALVVLLVVAVVGGT